MTVGDLDVSVSFITENGAKLGLWISNSRAQYKRGTLDQEKILLLEDIGIRWSIDDCRSQTSYPEQIFVFYLKKYFPDCINRYSDIGIEIDCFIPSINIV